MVLIAVNYLPADLLGADFENKFLAASRLVVFLSFSLFFFFFSFFQLN